MNVQLKTYTILFQIFLAVTAFTATPCIGTDSNGIADFERSHFRPYASDLADNLVANDAGIEGSALNVMLACEQDEIADKIIPILRSVYADPSHRLRKSRF